MSATHDALRKRAQQAPEPTLTSSDSWKPWHDARQPRTLVGIVCDEHEAKDCRVAEIEDDHGQTWTVWLDPAVLVRQWREDKPQVGELVAIDYRGHFEPRNGKSGALNLVLTVDREDDGGPEGFVFE
jgi:hypothetical protein